MEFLQFDFIVRGLQAGIIVAVIAPLIGIFLVLRRYSLIADTLAHVSLAGVAIGFILRINPILTAMLSTVVSSVMIERLRTTRRVYGESALAIFLSGSLAVAVVLISLAHGFSANLFNYLFGSVVTVRQSDVLSIFTAGLVVAVAVGLFFKELIYMSFDEEAAQVSGIPTHIINSILIVLTAVTVSLAIPVVGILLISALIVIPVAAALQLKRNFRQTVLAAEVISVFSVVAGIIASYYLNLAASGLIVIIALSAFIVALVLKRV